MWAKQLRNGRKMAGISTPIQQLVVQDQCHHSSIIIYCLRKASETLTKQKVGLRVRENLGLGLKFSPKP